MINQMDVRENGKFRLIFMHVPNIPNYLEHFNRIQDQYCLIPNNLIYRLTPRSFKVRLWVLMHD